MITKANYKFFTHAGKYTCEQCRNKCINVYRLIDKPISGEPAFICQDCYNKLPDLSENNYKDDFIEMDSPLFDQCDKCDVLHLRLAYISKVENFEAEPGYYRQEFICDTCYHSLIAISPTNFNCRCNSKTELSDYLYESFNYEFDSKLNSISISIDEAIKFHKHLIIDSLNRRFKNV